MPVHRAAKLIIFFFNPIEISTVSFMTLRSASASTVSFFKPSAPSEILKDMDMVLFEAIIFVKNLAQAESTVHMLNWAIRSVKFLGVEFDQSEDEEVSVSDTTHL